VAGELVVADGQIEYGGVLFGKGTPYRWKQLDGWEDLPDISTGNAARPGTHGAWPGRALAGERVVTWQGRIKAPPGQFSAAVRALRAATWIGDEQELVIRALDETLLAYGRVTRRIIPQDLEYRVGSGSFSIQWTCSDPLRYSLTEQHAQASIPVTTGAGLVYPLVYPLDYGPDPTVSSTVTVVNELGTDTPPRLVVKGPLEGPLIANLATNVQLEYDITLAEVDTLTIDCRTGEVLLNGGADRLYTNTAASVPPEMFTFAKGPNPIALRALNWQAGNRLDIYWRDATL
jgi:hypothetical protein